MNQTPETIDALMERFARCPWAARLEHICDRMLSDEERAFIGLCLVEAHTMGLNNQKDMTAELLDALKKSRAALAKANHASYCSAGETDCGCSCGLTAACISADAAIAKAEPVAVGRPPTWTNTCCI